MCKSNVFSLNSLPTPISLIVEKYLTLLWTRFGVGRGSCAQWVLSLFPPKAIHEAAEVFDVKTEYTFNWIQVITACFDSFAHGANDVANAVSTLAATVMVYNENDIPGCNGSKAGKSDVPLWILALGGVCIGVGVATWGYKIIETIGLSALFELLYFSTPLAWGHILGHLRRNLEW